MLRSLINIITYKHRHKINLYQIQCKDLLNKVKVTRVRRIPKLDYNYSFKKFKFCNISPHNTFIKFDKKKKNFKDITNLTDKSSNISDEFCVCFTYIICDTQVNNPVLTYVMEQIAEKTR